MAYLLLTLLLLKTIYGKQKITYAPTYVGILLSSPIQILTI